MGGKIGERKKTWEAAAIMVLGLISLPMFAGQAIQVKLSLVTDCPTIVGGTVAGNYCATDIGGWDPYNGQLNALFGTAGKYSILPVLSPQLLTNGGVEDATGDGTVDDGVYLPINPVQSEVLTNNGVYTLDTTTTEVNGTVGAGTLALRLHFYTDVSNRPPACWVTKTNPLTTTPWSYGGTKYIAYAIDEVQAVLWSFFNDLPNGFSRMNVGDVETGSARMDFNVRNGFCDQQVYRFYMTWSNAGGGVTITRLADDVVTGKRKWLVTTNAYGTATLYAQGGKGKTTTSYGDYREPFEAIMTEQ